MHTLAASGVGRHQPGGPGAGLLLDLQPVERAEMMLNDDVDEIQQARLLRRIADQDRQALSEFYDQVAAVLFATSVRILGDSHEAEEVVQDVFVQIWNKAAAFDLELGTPFHWALSITRNRAIDRVRSRQRRARTLDEFQQLAAGEPSPAAAPDKDGLGEDELAGIRAAVHGLPAEQRHALELAFFGGLTHTEIAQATGEPLGTVKARVRRGMAKLRDSLQAYA